MKKVFLTILLIQALTTVFAQESQTVYSFLKLPVSAHAAALGGDNISLTDDDPTVIFHNPALISNVTDKTINLNGMTYMEGAVTASASFIRAAGKRATWGVTGQFMSYGSIKETTVGGEIVGDFSPKDICLSGAFAYLLSEKISGGITAKFIYSTISGYTSMAAAVDLGVNYVNDDYGLSVSAVARNLGGQVKAYEDDFEAIPFDLQLGVSKTLGRAPIRLHATFTRLNKWDMPFINHFVVGADILLGSQFYICGGYNFRRAKEMRITADGDSESNHGAGLTLGAGMYLQRFKLNFAYAKYHVSSTSLMLNLSYSL
jgi:hypothetical protein